MARPGIEVTLLDVPGASSSPTDTGVWFAQGLTDRGPVAPTPVLSMNDFVTKFGPRVSYSVLYDALELFFREGGNKAYVGRVVGPAATVGTRNLLDAGAGISLVASAIGPGAWSTGYQIQVLAGGTAGTFVIRVIDAGTAAVLEDSGDLVDQNAAIAWSNRSNYIRITLGATALIPAVAAAAALSAGNDDRASVTDTQWQTSLDLFTNGYGPGQVSQPGRVTSTAWAQLITHAETHNRVALLDPPNTPTLGTLTAITSKSRFRAMFAPWVVIPGTVAGTIRTVPPSALVAGLIARNDAILGPDYASAGLQGISRFATDISQPNWSDADRQTLNAAGINVIRRMFDGIRVYGWRSGANPVTDLNWLDFGNARLFMSIAAELNAVGENFVFQNIDGQNGDTINAFHDGLSGVLKRHFNAGELFGESAADAYFVDTGPAVNTLVTIQNLELHAVCYVRMAPFAELIAIQIVKRQITDPVGV